MIPNKKNRTFGANCQILLTHHWIESHCYCSSWMNGWLNIYNRWFICPRKRFCPHQIVIFLLSMQWDPIMGHAARHRQACNSSQLAVRNFLKKPFPRPRGPPCTCASPRTLQTHSVWWERTRKSMGAQSTSIARLCRRRTEMAQVLSDGKDKRPKAI